jgi:lysophospholipase L1-like esterase
VSAGAGAPPRSRTPALFFAGSFLASCAISARLALWPAAFAFLAVGALGAYAVARRANAGRGGGPWLSLAVLNVVLAVPELGLRSADFRYVSGVEFGYPTPTEFVAFAPDRDLFWKLPSDDPLANSFGFFGAEPRVPKPANTWRWLVLGDSCSQQGYPNAWPEVATLALHSIARTREVDEVNFALSGYSSHQGRVLAERYGALLAPDLVAVYFGWNDHWLAWGAVDADKRIDPSFERVYRWSRLLQAARKLADGVRGARATPLDRTRVPIDTYRANLTAICAAFSARGSKVVLLTAPSAIDLTGVADYLLSRPFARDAESVTRLHREYNAVVREVAAANGAMLVDLERDFEHGNDRARLFLADGIHLSDAGKLAVAQRFAEVVREQLGQ